jgi:hypothetical protein
VRQVHSALYNPFGTATLVVMQMLSYFGIVHSSVGDNLRTILDWNMIQT